MEKFKVTFHPSKKSIEVAKDTTVLSAAISAGVYINSACGGDGVCGRCKVILKKGHLFMQPTGLLSPKEKKRGVYLACLSAVQSDLEIEVPVESAADFEKLNIKELHIKEKAIYSQAEEVETLFPVNTREAFSVSPLVTKLYLELPLPTLEDKISDLERLYRQIRRHHDIEVIQISWANIRALGELLRSSDWKVTVSLGKRIGSTEVILVEPQDRGGKNFGICFDIGTTTLNAQLIDLNTKKVLGTKAVYNKQATFGADVITRIIYAQEPEGLEQLHRAVVEGMNQMVQELASEHGVDLNEVTCAVCAGNTTMIHLLLRIDPTYIRKEPYVPVANFLPVFRAHEAGIKINPHGILTCIPGVSSYVGGDVTAGVLSSGIYKEDEVNILIDIGTNGEVVLGNKEFMVACAASAGPAFEGSGVACGMRAAKGAIQKVKISKGDFNLAYETIGGAKPKGICGSGYIDLVAQMLTSGILDRDGKIKNIKHKRIRSNDLGREFVVAFKEESVSATDIVITEVDIDNLKRAKAAIYAATLSLVKYMDLNLNKIAKIYIAGGFGTSVDMHNAIAIGLLPDLPREKIIFVGNSSLSGARQALLSNEAMRKADELAEKITYLELSVEPGYMDEYMAALFFPHTDLLRFPSIRA